MLDIPVRMWSCGIIGAIFPSYLGSYPINSVLLPEYACVI
jgi:hypothetical protein